MASELHFTNVFCAAFLISDVKDICEFSKHFRAILLTLPSTPTWPVHVLNTLSNFCWQRPQRSLQMWFFWARMHWNYSCRESCWCPVLCEPDFNGLISLLPFYRSLWLPVGAKNPSKNPSLLCFLDFQQICSQESSMEVKIWYPVWYLVPKRWQSYLWALWLQILFVKGRVEGSSK